MAYFPAFIQLDHKKIIIIGGGVIAQEKLEKLLDFTSEITLLAKEFSDEILKLIKKHNLTYIHKEYKEGDIKEYGVVIVAVDDIELQKQIHKESRSYNCLLNVVDLPELCDFIFPSYIKDGDLTIAVSTSGASPAMAKQLRLFIQSILPKDINDFLQEMREYRKTLPKGIERMKMLEEKAKNYIQGIQK
ncbi:MAG: bifunctional precorrin-2 dehydrogenase/sirohydrochlorin ferrochelatase [Epsilonproteobacteria bacterium]|nr:bifunctional precorrin-2 dehydrogenase/sirohydrochlorin ferrochelatase [Campylobacterota bacterium]